MVPDLDGSTLLAWTCLKVSNVLSTNLSTVELRLVMVLLRLTELTRTDMCPIPGLVLKSSVVTTSLMCRPQLMSTCACLMLARLTYVWCDMLHWANGTTDILVEAKLTVILLLSRLYWKLMLKWHGRCRSCSRWDTARWHIYLEFLLVLKLFLNMPLPADLVILCWKLVVTLVSWSVVRTLLLWPGLRTVLNWLLGPNVTSAGPLSRVKLTRVVLVCAIALLAGRVLTCVPCLSYESMVVKWPRPFLTPRVYSIVENGREELYVKKQYLEQSDAHRCSGLVLRIVLSFRLALSVRVLCTRLVKQLLRLEVCTLRDWVSTALSTDCWTVFTGVLWPSSWKTPLELKLMSRLPTRGSTQVVKKVTATVL